MLFPQRRRRLPNPEAVPDYWMSYSDVMAGLIFAFILLMVLVMAGFRFQERQVAVQEQQVAAQERELARARQENQAMRQQIAQYLGVKEEIINKLRLEFGDRIAIDQQTGAITFSDDVLFAYNSSTLSAMGREQLRDFVPRYVRVLLGPTFRPYIAQIIIEGHTDSSGGYLYNLELSQQRALAVARYIFSPEFPGFPERQDLQALLSANGRSYSQLKLAGGQEDPQASRRVEFKFRLKDEEAIRQVQALLEGDLKGEEGEERHEGPAVLSLSPQPAGQGAGGDSAPAAPGPAGGPEPGGSGAGDRAAAPAAGGPSRR